MNKNQVSFSSTLSVFKQVWFILSKQHRKSLLVLLFLMAIGAFLEMVGISLVLPIIAVLVNDERVVQNPGFQKIVSVLGHPEQKNLVIIFTVGMCAVYLFKNLFLGFMSWYQARFNNQVREDVSNLLFRSYMLQPYSYHTQRNSADLIQAVAVEVNQFSSNTLAPLTQLIAEGLVLMGLGVMILLVEPVIALSVLAALFLASYLFNYVTNKRVVLWGSDRKYHETVRMRHLQQAIQFVKDIKIFNREQSFLNHFYQHNRKTAEANEKYSAILQLPKLWLEVLAIFALAGIIIALILSGRQLVEVVTTLSFFAASAFRVLPSVGRVLASLQSFMFGYTSIDSLFKEISENQLTADNEVFLQDIVPMNFRREIEFKNITFTYPGAISPTLNNISFKISKGEKIGIIGPSGSGKSTLVDLLLGLLTPDSGEIFVDGVSLQNRFRSWREKIGYVPQVISLIDDSIKSNIIFGWSDHSDKKFAEDQVWTSIKRSQLYDVVASRPLGLSEVIGERGVRFSGGQRQRLGIARALFLNPEILVLDEATSSLDSATEASIIEDVLHSNEGKTIVIIAHRLSTLSHCHRIIEVRDGQVTKVDRSIQPEPETQL